MFLLPSIHSEKQFYEKDVSVRWMVSLSSIVRENFLKELGWRNWQEFEELACVPCVKDTLQAVFEV